MRGCRMRWLLIVALCCVVVAGCSGEEPTATGPGTTAGAKAGADPSVTTTVKSKDVLRIMVTNDDGIGAEGIDAVVIALRGLPNTEIVVIAPADQQSGQGAKTTEGALDVGEALTRSGVGAKTVAGYPADTVIWALDQGGLAERPHLVVSGVNEGQNLGPVIGISGTIGAARAAAARGVPALAASQGAGNDPDYASAVGYVLDWIGAHRDALVSGTVPPGVTSINSPTCAVGEVRGLVEVPPAADAAGRNVVAADIDCSGKGPAGSDDVGAFNVGFATQSDVPVAG
ncbi:MAG: survival protein SurE [Microthrixaceae bacterium]|nr:survival protein SurE [Microthrixaceae bacterium]